MRPAIAPHAPSLFLAVMLAPGMASAGVLTISCGVAGTFGHGACLKIIATSVVMMLAMATYRGKLSIEIACLCCAPIILLASGPALLYIPGQDC